MIPLYNSRTLDLDDDNCIMESFFGTIKNEMFYGHET